MLIKTVADNYFKNRTFRKSSYNQNIQLNKNNTIIQIEQRTSSGIEICASHQQPKTDNILY